MASSCRQLQPWPRPAVGRSARRRPVEERRGAAPAGRLRSCVRAAVPSLPLSTRRGPVPSPAFRLSHSPTLSRRGRAEKEQINSTALMPPSSRGKQAFLSFDLSLFGLFFFFGFFSSASVHLCVSFYLCFVCALCILPFRLPSLLSLSPPLRSAHFEQSGSGHPSAAFRPRFVPLSAFVGLP